MVSWLAFYSDDPTLNSIIDLFHKKLKENEERVHTKRLAKAYLGMCLKKYFKQMRLRERSCDLVVIGLAFYSDDLSSSRG